MDITQVTVVKFDDEDALIAFMAALFEPSLVDDSFEPLMKKFEASKPTFGKKLRVAIDRRLKASKFATNWRIRLFHSGF